MSPRASNATRFPVGDTDTETISFSAFVARAQRRRVGDDADGHFGDLLARQAEEINASALLKDDRVGTDRRKRDVEVVELRHLTHRAGAEILGPDVVALLGAAIGNEIDRV